MGHPFHVLWVLLRVRSQVEPRLCLSGVGIESLSMSPQSSDLSVASPTHTMALLGRGEGTQQLQTPGPGLT